MFYLSPGERCISANRVSGNACLTKQPMEKTKTYNYLFACFFVSVVFVFVLIRPLNSPWHRFIGGDGLGYYVYLPANYIYNDSGYTYKWFNKVYEAYYFANGGSADENFLVTYQNKRINKYYPGLSFLWLPFFGLAHLLAYIGHYPMDGFSLPYQLGIAFASLCYLFLGLFYLRRLLFSISKSQFISFFVPVILFYGSFLFHYAINLNSLTHVYSFSFVTMFVYYLHCYFHNVEKRLLHLIMLLLLLCVIVFIRPLNVLVLLLVPAFIKKPSALLPLKFEKFGVVHFLLLGITGWMVLRQFFLQFTQSGRFFPNAYQGEVFYFMQPRLVDVLVSYHAGFFVYVPIAFVALFGIPYLKGRIQKLIFPFVLFLICYIYSSWWYWSITSRALIDYYVLVAICLTALLQHLQGKRLQYKGVVAVLCLLTVYHQLKALQFRRHVLDENYTHKELFWKNFFRTTTGNFYAVPPSSVLKRLNYYENFESSNYAGMKSDSLRFNGNYSALLNANSDYSKAFNYPIPQFFKQAGLKKLKFSFRSFCIGDLKEFQVYFNFYNAKKELVVTVPFYIKSEAICRNTWDIKEFGYELSDTQLLELKPELVSIFLWNNEQKNALFIDAVKTEMILTDKSYEIIQ